MSDYDQTPGWVIELTEENFLAIYDVSLDIRQELQISDRPAIPLWQPVVKFRPLMPWDGVNMRDRYCDLRWKAANVLKRQCVIRNCEILPGTHRWESRLRITADKTSVDAFVKQLDAEYTRRAQPSDDEGKPTSPSIEVASRNVLRAMLFRFHSVAVQLRQRHDARPTLDVSDEYDVQDLLHALLRLHFDDIRPEEWTPSYAGKSSRVDFLLKREAIVVEVKKTRAGLGEKQISEQLIIDIARYAKMGDCKTLVCFIYDPENRITNSGGLETDLSGDRDGMFVEVMVLPKQY